MDDLFPRGLWPYVLGGISIGLGVALIFVLTGIRAGVSGVLSSSLAFVSRRPAFARFREERGWRALFTLGLVLGGAAVALSSGGVAPTDNPLWRLAVGGFLVGLGTRFARGCTSGHGICGLSSLDRNSLVHVLTFMGVAILTAKLIEGLS